MENNIPSYDNLIFQTEIDNEKLKKNSNTFSKESTKSFYLKKKHNSLNVIKIKILISFSYQKENYEFLYQFSNIANTDNQNNNQQIKINIKEILNALLPKLNHTIKKNII